MRSKLFNDCQVAATCDRFDTLNCQKFCAVASTPRSHCNFLPVRHSEAFLEICSQIKDKEFLRSLGVDVE